MQRKFPPRVKAKTMANVLKFDGVPHRPTRTRKIEPAHEEAFSFWPEVSQGMWVSSEPPPADPMNSAGRVLLEMMLILGATAAIAVVISMFVGMPPV